MNQYAIDQFFNSVTFTSFEGSLQSLAQIISRSTGSYVKSHDILEYFLLKNYPHNYCIKVYFANGEASVFIQENNP